MSQQESEDKTRDDLPLHGIRVMITRPRRQVALLDRALRDLGAKTLLYPTISIEPVDDPAGWAAFRNATPDNCWLIFTSANGVSHFMGKVEAEADRFPALNIFKTAVIGAGTARALREHHVAINFIATETTSTTLVSGMLKAYELKDVDIIRVRGNLVDDIIEKRLSEAGAIVKTLTTYSTTHYLWPEEMKQPLLQNPPDAILFASGSAVEGFCHNLDEKEVSFLLGKTKFFSFGASASEALQKRGWTIAGQAQEPTTSSLIGVLLKYYRREKS